MQELGLTASALNDRYFKSDLQKTTSLMGGSESFIGVTDKIESLANFKKEKVPNSNLNGHLSKTVMPNMSSRPLPAQPDGDDMSLGQDRNRSHLIRPSSRSSSSSLSSNVSNDADYPMHDKAGRKESGDGGKTEANSRYVKYNMKDEAPRPPYSHTSKAYIDRRDIEFTRPRGSAMSDTSESPSLASHVKNIRIPSHTSELDQYLDDLFNPVLDANLDELSDARSLAASIKGGTKSKKERIIPKKSPLSQIVLMPNSTETQAHSRLIEHLVIDNAELDDLMEPDKLALSLKGGGRKEEAKVCNFILSI
jgi:myosin-15